MRSEVTRRLWRPILAKNSASILGIRNLFVSYGHVAALHDVSIEVRSREAVGLIGSNGAGKSTLMKAILGTQKPLSGSIHFLSKDITFRPAEKTVRSGLALVPEGRGILPMMTVLDNLELGGYLRRKGMKESLALIFGRFPILYERRRQMAGFLSGGEQQMLSIGRALMSAPKLLMLDEPSLGLAPIIVNDIFHSLGELRETGCVILLAEQNARRVLRFADRIYVLETGCMVGHGTPRELDDDHSLIKAYFGMPK